ncbi:MAG: hypothetical protein ABSF25_02545 [Bryobacteraceae bacterium]
MAVYTARAGDFVKPNFHSLVVCGEQMQITVGQPILAAAGFQPAFAV